MRFLSRIRVCLALLAKQWHDSRMMMESVASTVFLWYFQNFQAIGCSKDAYAWLGYCTSKVKLQLIEYGHDIFTS